MQAARQVWRGVRSVTSGVGNERKKVCLVVGAGGGIGGHVAQRFARGGEFHAVLCRRSDGEGLQRMVSQISAAEEGGATGRLLNVVEEGSIEQLIADVETNIGPIHTAVYNIGAQFGDRSLAQTSQKAFEMGWRLGTLGLFRLATAALPHMAERGTGALIVTSATAAVRGNPGQHSHASAMGGRRMLCQTLNGEFARKGVHVAHVLVDGAVDAPDTLGKMLGAEKFEEFRAERGEHGLIQPKCVADTYWHLAHQERSTWTFECDLRSWTDRPWWN